MRQHKQSDLFSCGKKVCDADLDAALNIENNKLRLRKCIND